jgi:hypothetical protein
MLNSSHRERLHQNLKSVGMILLSISSNSPESDSMSSFGASKS